MQNQFSVKQGFISILLCAIAILCCACSTDKERNIENVQIETESPYAIHLQEYKQDDENIEIEIASLSTVAQGEFDTLYNYEGCQGDSIYLSEDSCVSFDFSIEKSGYYCFEFTYFPIDGSGSSILRDIAIDGKVPFDEFQQVAFSRAWENAIQDISEDIYGNEIMQLQVEKKIWLQEFAYDSTGYYAEPLRYYLTEGKHSISLNGVREPMLLNKISISKYVAAPSYEELLEVYTGAGYQMVQNVQPIVIEAEDASCKSDQTMYPLNDKTSPLVSPSSAAKTVYNIIGGNQWKTTGQWIEWEYEVPSSGLYSIGLHFKQSLKSSNISVRALFIDGFIPFVEASKLEFAYDASWQNHYLSDKDNEPYLFYMEEGRHTIRLKVALGDYSQIIAEANYCMEELNRIYREIVVVTGASPDEYRDYHFETLIPTTLEDINSMSQRLKILEKALVNLNNNDSLNIAQIQNLYIQFDGISEDPDTIAARLATYKNNISSFGTWVNGLIEQPLELDYITIATPEYELEKGDAGLGELVWFQFKQFLYSFCINYSEIGKTDVESDTSITVWMTAGRDQSQILKQLINSDFTAKENIGVDLQLVSADSLLPAILSDQGPDVILNLEQTMPVNLALRGAAHDLTSYPDYEEVVESFNANTITSFKFEDGTYALPETLTYPMLFYRTDILEEMDIDVEQLDTWEDILESVLPKLMKKSLTLGVPANFESYMMFLYQNNGDLYQDNTGKKSLLDSNSAIQAMEQFSMLYTQYGIPQDYDFANRFRTGEMPIAIADYTAYNQLTVFAPEIKGEWEMLPVPGVVDESGNLNHDSHCIVTGSLILEDSDNKEAAWQFLKWWLSEQTQSSYGKQLESVVGSAARYNSANIGALASVSWDGNIGQSLMTQLQSLRAYPEVPGGYITTRLYDFAFRNIVYDEDDIRETMTSTADDIEAEIVNKRKDYNLD